MQTQGFPCPAVLSSVYHQAVNGEHLQTTALPGFIHLPPAKEVRGQILSSLPALPQSPSPHHHHPPTPKWVGAPAWHDTSVQSQPPPGGKSTASFHVQIPSYSIASRHASERWLRDTTMSTTTSAAVTRSESNTDLSSMHQFCYTPSSYNLPGKHAEIELRNRRSLFRLRKRTQ